MEMLERSQPRPIAVDARFILDSTFGIDYTIPQHDIRNVNRLLSEQFHRIKNLTILFPPELRDEISNIFSSSALVLESLHLDVFGIGGVAEPLSLPAEMFSF